MDPAGASSTRLIDRFGRHVTYVRISVTDRCDFRCVYCMSEEMRFLPRAKILTLEEIQQVVRAFCELGVHKVRITGGEPLVRRNVIWLFREVGKLPGLKELVLTTNGSQLVKMAPALKEAGVRRINISLDSLQHERFRRLTRVGDLDKVLRGIDAALAVDFDRVKVNSVVLKNRNHDEVHDLVQFCIDRGMDISFIEEMPLGVIGERDRAESYYSSGGRRRRFSGRIAPTRVMRSGAISGSVSALSLPLKLRGVRPGISESQGPTPVWASSHPTATTSVSCATECESPQKVVCSYVWARNTRSTCATSCGPVPEIRSH